MKIIESLIVSKTGKEETCEDGIFFNDNFAAVIDGCTNKSKTKNDRAPGRIAMEIIKKSISSFSKDITCNQAFNKITDDIKQWYIQKHLFETVKDNPIYRISACAVIYSNYYKQLWFLGDCQAIVDNKHYCFDTKIEEYTSSIRSFLIYAELQKGKTKQQLQIKDTAREKLLPILAEQAYLQNELGIGPFAYSVFNGFKIREEDIHIIKLKENDKTIVLSSDGYPFLKNTLKESEDSLKDLLEKDPLLYKEYKATKALNKNNLSFDDRSYLKITVY